MNVKGKLAGAVRQDRRECEKSSHCLDVKRGGEEGRVMEVWGDLAMSKTHGILLIFWGCLNFGMAKTILALIWQLQEEPVPQGFLSLTNFGITFL
jgi:hypothetical protein